MDQDKSLDQLAEEIKGLNEGMQDSLLNMLRAAFKRDNLSLDRDKLAALEVIALPPIEGDDEEDQVLLDEEYRTSLATAMPVIRFLIPEVYTLRQQTALFKKAQDNACSDQEPDENGHYPINANIPIRTAAGVIKYDAGCLAIMLENPFDSLDEDDHRMLAVFRLTLNL